MCSQYLERANSLVSLCIQRVEKHDWSLGLPPCLIAVIKDVRGMGMTVVYSRWA